MATLEGIRNHVIVENLKGKIGRISKAMEGGSEQSLYELRDMLERRMWNPPLRELSLEMEPSTMAIVWVVTNFLDMLWRTFGGGNTGFPIEVGGRFLGEISTGLGKTIQESLAGRDYTESLGKVLLVYCAFCNLCAERAETEDGTNWVVLPTET